MGKINLYMFKESDGTFSWRKAGTALIFLAFTYAIIGWLHTHHFDELPPSYMFIIGGVFGLYFVRKSLNSRIEK